MLVYHRSACILFVHAWLFPFVSSSDVITELVGLVPSQGPVGILNWVNVTYPSDLDSCEDVVFSSGAGNAELGAWDCIDLQQGLLLTGKNFGDFFYGYVNTGLIPIEGPCCADTMRIWSKSDGSHRDVDLVTPLEAAWPTSSFDYATHTFEVAELEGDVVAFCMAQFQEEELGGAKVDVVVAVSMSSGELVPTKAGDAFFSLWEQLGTTSQDPSESVYKVQFAPWDGSGNQEEWHGNGVSVFTTSGGTPVLALTHRNLNEALLLRDPWRSGKTGGEILQRFGLVANGAEPTVTHVFGLNSSDLGAGESWDGVHNVRYSVSPIDGRESVTVFVNSVSSSPNSSWVFEFDLKLVPEGSAEQQTQTPAPKLPRSTDVLTNATSFFRGAATNPELASNGNAEERSGLAVVDDSVFATTYRFAPAPYLVKSQGGARPIGHTDGAGVWLVSSGTTPVGLGCVDQKGGERVGFPANVKFYDPFTFIVQSG